MNENVLRTRSIQVLEEEDEDDYVSGDKVSEREARDHKQLQDIPVSVTQQTFPSGDVRARRNRRNTSTGNNASAGAGGVYRGPQSDRVAMGNHNQPVHSHALNTGGNVPAAAAGAPQSNRQHMVLQQDPSIGHVDQQGRPFHYLPMHPPQPMYVPQVSHAPSYGQPVPMPAEYFIAPDNRGGVPPMYANLAAASQLIQAAGVYAAGLGAPDPGEYGGYPGGHLQSTWLAPGASGGHPVYPGPPAAGYSTHSYYLPSGYDFSAQSTGNSQVPTSYVMMQGPPQYSGGGVGSGGGSQGTALTLAYNDAIQHQHQNQNQQHYQQQQQQQRPSRRSGGAGGSGAGGPRNQNYNRNYG